MYQHFPGRSNFKLKPLNWLIGSGATGILGYFLSEKTPFTNRRKLILISKQFEQYEADRSYFDIIRQSRKYLLSKNTYYHRKVNYIATKIINSNEIFKEMPLDWTVHIINSNQANAFVLPNGKIFIYTGIFQFAQTDSELAAVISHELSHVIARHSAESMSFLNVLAVACLFLGIPVSAVNSFLSLTYSRKLEYEADEIGLHIMSNACFDPESAASLWKRFEMQSKDSSTNIEFLSTHPTHSNRQQRIRELLPLMGDWKRNCPEFNKFFERL